jgi:hypothetical protein
MGSSSKHIVVIGGGFDGLAGHWDRMNNPAGNNLSVNYV